MLRFLAFALPIVIAVNAVTILTLLRVHPRHRRFTFVMATVGNLMWLFLPILNARTPFSRLIRASLGPPWFVWLVFAILYSAFVALVALLGRIRGSHAFPRFARWPSRIFLSVAFAGALAGCYEALVPLRIEHVRIGIDGLPKEAEGKRLALLADLHVGLFTRLSRLRQFFAVAGALRPDAVILAGDLIDDDPAFVAKLLRGTSTLPPSIPLFAVLGNHEMYGAPWEVIARLRGSRIHLLLNQGTAVRGVWLAGLSDFAARDERLLPDIDSALAGRATTTPPILIAHQPKAFDSALRHHIPLTLVGHTHGGQFGFRPLHWSLAGLFLPYHMGLYRVGTSQLYVNTGTGYWLVPFRLGMTPEITLIELHSTGRSR
jgi:predicted MPP superfamily phosphohydrolase